MPTDDLSPTDDKTRALTVGLVQAYVANNHVQGADLTGLIRTVYETLTTLDKKGAVDGAPAEVSAAHGRPSPAQIRKSVTHEVIVSFEDGRGYKTLRRHLTARGLTPETYRAKWGLPHDYPMVAPSYSEQRSSLARSVGLGNHRKGDQAD